MPGTHGAASELADADRRAEAACADGDPGRAARPATACSDPETGLPGLRLPAAPVHQPRRHRLRLARARGRPYLTVEGQQFVPGRPQRESCFPLVFCRECGQEYYSRPARAPDAAPAAFLRRAATVATSSSERRASRASSTSAPTTPGPTATRRACSTACRRTGSRSTDGADACPANRRDYLPQPVQRRAGRARGRPRRPDAPLARRPRSASACAAGWPTALAQRSDFGKLAALGSEGRSTATTILSLSAIRQPAASGSLEPQARKLLSFTDNRQDASLQAGHFNDFVEVGAPARGALHGRPRRPARRAARTTMLTQRVFDALALPVEALRAATRRAVPGREPRRSGPCGTCSATASTATCGAAGASPRRTSSSAACWRSATRSLDELCAAEESGRTAITRPGDRHARDSRSGSHGCCSTSCAASWRSRSTTSTPTCQERSAASRAASG